MRHEAPPSARPLLPLLGLGLGLCLSSAGCGAGTAGAIAGMSGGGGGGVEPPPPRIDQVLVSGQGYRVSPTPVVVQVADIKPDEEKFIDVYYVQAEPNGSYNLSKAKKISTLKGKPGGQVQNLDIICFDWDLPKYLGAGYHEDVKVFAKFAEKPLQSVQLNGSNSSAPLDFGNTPPVVTIPLAQAAFSGDEQSDIVLVQFELQDAQSHFVDVFVQFLNPGTDPSDPSNWLLAKAAGQQFKGITAPASKVQLVFAWDSASHPELEDYDGDEGVYLRMWAQEVQGAGPDPCSGSVCGATGCFQQGVVVDAPGVIQLDNNEEPNIEIDIAGFTLNPDRRRGIPIPFEVFDENDGPVADEVGVAFQWHSLDGADYPDLDVDGQSGVTAADIEMILADPLLRRQKQIASELPPRFEGRVLGQPGSTTARLPELAGSAATLVTAQDDPVVALRDRRLEILRPSFQLGPVVGQWPASGSAFAPAGPVGIVERPSPEKDHALVLDAGGAGTWRLSEVALSNGASAGAPLASGPGVPLALASGPMGRAAFVAAESGAGNWAVYRVELVGTGGMALVQDAASGGPLGTVHGLVALPGQVLLLTVGTQLVRIDFDVASATQVTAEAPELIVTGQLQAPWGLAPDPGDDRKVFVSDRVGQAIVSLDLEDLSVRRLEVGGLPLSEPTDLALERSGNRLLVVTDQVPGGTRELRAISLGRNADVDGDGRADLELFELQDDLPASTAGLSSGRDGLRLACEPAADGLWAGGGVQQSRVIVDYDVSMQEVEVDSPFHPALTPGATWRIERTASRMQTFPGEAPRRAVFVWDSADFPGTGDVEVRALVFDKDLQEDFGSGVPKAVRGSLDVSSEKVPGVIGPLRVPRSTLVDLDADGDLDFLGAAEPLGSGGVITLIQDPAQVFGPQSPLASAATYDLTADLDGDGLIDVVANGSVHYQDPSAPGSFLPPVAIASGRATATGDVDGNGFLDLLVADGAQVTVWLQGPLGTFQSQPGFSVSSCIDAGNGECGFEARLADFDGDGRLDVLAHLADKPPRLGVFLQGVGGFAASPEYLLRSVQGNITAYALNDFDVADLDLDGAPDVVVTTNAPNLANPDVGVTFVFMGPAQGPLGGTVTPSTTLSAALLAGRPTSVTLADLDDDQDLDLLVVHHKSDDLGVLPNTVLYFQTGPGVFELDLGGSLPPVSQPATVQIPVGDLDGDGHLDLAALYPKDLVLAYASSPGAFSPPDYLFGSPSGYVLALPGDFDHDGDLDLVAPWQGQSKLHLFRQVDPGRFEDTPALLPVSFSTLVARALRRADLNADGRMDLVALGDDASKGLFAWAIQPAGQGAWSSGKIANPSSMAGKQLELADLDADGLADVVVALPASLRAYRQSPGGGFAATTFEDFGSGGSFALLDFDGDGDVDVLEATPASDLVWYAQDDTTGAFGAANTLVGGAGRNLSAVADVDRDGLLDVLMNNDFTFPSGSVDLYLQTSPGIFGATPIQSPGNALEVAVEDVDRDGYLDLFVLEPLQVRTLAPRLQVRPGVFLRSARHANNQIADLQLSDLDGDGEVDLSFASPNSIRLQLHYGGR